VQKTKDGRNVQKTGKRAYAKSRFDLVLIVFFFFKVFLIGCENSKFSCFLSHFA